jgi:hypothetical protein
VAGQSGAERGRSGGAKRRGGGSEWGGGAGAERRGEERQRCGARRPAGRGLEGPCSDRGRMCGPCGGRGGRRLTAAGILGATRAALRRSAARRQARSCPSRILGATRAARRRTAARCQARSCPSRPQPQQRLGTPPGREQRSRRPSELCGRGRWVRRRRDAGRARLPRWPQPRRHLWTVPGREQRQRRPRASYGVEPPGGGAPRAEGDQEEHLPPVHGANACCAPRKSPPSPPL